MYGVTKIIMLPGALYYYFRINGDNSSAFKIHINKPNTKSMNCPVEMAGLVAPVNTSSPPRVNVMRNNWLYRASLTGGF